MAKLKNDTTFADGTVLRTLIDSKSDFSGNYSDLSGAPTSLPANGGNANSVNNYSLWVGTQSEYDAISTKSNTILYFIKEA